MFGSEFNREKAWNDIFKPVETVKIVFLNLLCQKLDEDRFFKLKTVLKH